MADDMAAGSVNAANGSAAHSLEDSLDRILREGSTAECVAYFRGMPEAERRALAPRCVKWAREVRANRIEPVNETTFRVSRRIEPAVAAVFATGTFSDLKRAPWKWFHDEEAVYELLRDRRPAWLEEWAALVLDDSHYWLRWRPLRRLVRDGLLARPTHPHYFLALAGGLVTRFERDKSLRDELLKDPGLLDEEVWRLFEFEGGGENSLALVDGGADADGWTQVLARFVREGRLDRARMLDAALAALARDFNHFRARWFLGYFDALEPTPEELARHAVAMLGLLRASAPNVVTWALDNVARLAAAGAYTAEQLADGLEAVLRAKAKSVVMRGLDVLKAAAMNAADAAEGISLAASEAVAHEKVDVQAAALRLLEALDATRFPKVAARVEALSRGVAASLRNQVAQLLERRPEANTTGDLPTPKNVPTAAVRSSTTSKAVPKPALGAATESAGAPVLAPDLRQSLSIDRLMEVGRQASWEIPAAVFDGTEIARLTPFERLTPIEEFDELIEICSRVVEDETLVDDAERCFDSLSRLCANKPEDWERRIAPLLKRVRKLLATSAPPFVGIGPAGDLCGLILAFATGVVVRPKLDGRVVVLPELGDNVKCFAANLRKGLGFLSLRSQAIAERLATGKAAPLLSAPTHSGGWIEASELVQRTNGWQGEPPDVTDVVLALLRLAPDGRETALKKLTTSDVEWRRAVHYALGGEEKIGETAALWVAAARSRFPWANDDRVEAAFPGLGPDAGLTADYSYRFEIDQFKFARLTLSSTPPAPKDADRLLPTVILHSQRARGREFTFELGGAGGKTVGAVRWSATIWPGARESYFAAGWADLADNIDWSEANWQFRTYLEPLLDPGTPLRKMGLVMLVTCLAAKEPGEQGLAVDVAIRAISDGRLGNDNLGRALAELLPTGIIKPGRWQKSLAEVARTSTQHAAVVLLGLQRGLRGDADSLPKDTGKLLELAVELCHQLTLPVVDEDCRAWLQQFGKSGKFGKLATSLLAIEGEGAQEKMAEVASAAIESRFKTRTMVRSMS